MDQRNSLQFPSSHRFSYNSGDASTTHNEDDNDTLVHQQELAKAHQRTWAITLLLVFLGAGASTAFVYLGITASNHETYQTFERRASDLSQEIVQSFRDYENAALWIHEACRGWPETCSRDDFADVYQYIVSGGLEFYLAEWIPNVTNAERPGLEAETGAYYNNATLSGMEYHYHGFVGLEPNPEDPNGFGIFDRSERPYYFPVHYFEPQDHVGDAIHLDLNSLPDEERAIHEALRWHKPILTEPFVLVSQESDGFSVSLLHPGIPLPGDRYRPPKDLALLLIHIRSLMARAARFQGVSLAVYLFDTTHEDDANFLGGANVLVVEQDTTNITYFDETTLERVRQSAPNDDLYYQDRLEVGSRRWTIAVVPCEGDDTFEASYVSSILTGVVVFGASLLLAWVWVLHNRARTSQLQKIVTKAAAESKIVQNLYPAAVRDNLIAEQQQQQQQQHEEAQHPPTAVQEQQSSKDVFQGIEFNPFSASAANVAEPDNVDGTYKTKPIADRYEATTIMFADLAGFTAWSAERTPEDVFTLLETLYGAFDAIAKRRRVFKVETIGDCYVAVTGLPKPRQDHAVVMCRFATDCLHKMQKLVRQLAKGTLGPETANLCFRVGLHSGSVTAGVLRGDKGRFQLFGDTMNTASRMESTGVKNKIQVSEDTADLIVQGGYQKWLTPREDMVHAKGKGTVRTFFVNILAGSVSSRSSGFSKQDPSMTSRLPLATASLASQDTASLAEEEDESQSFQDEYEAVVDC